MCRMPVRCREFPDPLRSADSSVVLLGARETLGATAAVVAASYIGFGAYASTTDVPVWVIVLSTFTMWALPGQLVLVDMWHVGAPLVAVLLTVMLTNARFLPMTVTMLPVLHDPAHPRWRYYAVAHFVSMISWAVCMRRCPELPPARRLEYLVGMALVCVGIGAVSGACGYFAAGWIPPAVQLGLIFLTPVNFFVMLIGDLKERLGALALICGAAAGPLFYLLTPQWSVLLAGLAGGTLAFALSKALEARRV
jgi:predicted branched-subunit amino acid permease